MRSDARRYALDKTGAAPIAQHTNSCLVREQMRKTSNGRTYVYATRLADNTYGCTCASFRPSAREDKARMCGKLGLPRSGRKRRKAKTTAALPSEKPVALKSTQQKYMDLLKLHPTPPGKAMVAPGGVDDKNRLQPYGAVTTSYTNDNATFPIKGTFAAAAAVAVKATQRHCGNVSHFLNVKTFSFFTYHETKQSFTRRLPASLSCPSWSSSSPSVPRREGTERRGPQRSCRRF